MMTKSLGTASLPRIWYALLSMCQACPVVQHHSQVHMTLC